jgi:hypothetical protein
VGGGGAGNVTGSGTSGTANTGGGGGGSGAGFSVGGTGGSGIVILRYPDTFRAATTFTEDATHTYTVSGGFRIYTFLANGSITF